MAGTRSARPMVAAGGWRLAGLLLSSGLAACAATEPPPGVQSTRIVAASPEAAGGRVEAALRGLGFTTSGLAGGGAPTVRGELGSGFDPAWARCPGIWTNDPFSDLGRSRFVQAGGRRTVVVVRTSRLPQGTSVEVDARTLGLYTHAFTGQTIESPCDSTGLLEGRLLDAAAATG